MTSVETFDQTASEQRTGNSLCLSLGSGLLGDRWLRMWDGCEPYEYRERWRAASLSQDLLAFTNDVDDVVDAPNLNHSERVSIMRSGANHLLAGRCDCENECSPVMHSARELHYDFVQQKPQFKATFTELFESGLSQLEDASLTAQQETASIIGATCMRLSVHAGEYVSKKAAPADIIAAANSLGSFSYFLDLAYEFKSDIAHDNQTYATLLIAAGSSPAVVKRQLQVEAAAHLDHGVDYLTTKQRRSYKALAKLVQLKYTLQGGVAWLV